MVDNVILIDNSTVEGKLIMEISNGKITFNSVNQPKWVNPIHEQFRLRG